MSKPDTVTHTYNPTIGEAEVGGLWVWGHPEQLIETLPKKINRAVDVT